jgi:site-specific recombinase XerD
MKTWTFNSCLAAQIAAFIDLRRLSGTDYHSQAQLLSYFDRFLVEQNVRQPLITREICDRYLLSLKRLAPRGQANRLCVVRQLCEYLARTEPSNYIPEPLRAPTSRSSHQPYIFTDEQVKKLLSAALTLPPSGSLRPHTYHTLLGVLYTTGIRVGEAFALNIEHFFPEERRLFIAEGKFRKSRWIVLSASTTGALSRYLMSRLNKEAKGPEEPLLLNERRQRLCHPTVRQGFMDVLHACGIPWDRQAGPRIHDMRHSFAVHRLLAWYRDGEDVNARLPALATYMGHVDISSTQVYLQPTAELLGEVDRRFHDHFLNHVLSKGSLS